jgi:hypothetical protein
MRPDLPSRPAPTRRALDAIVWDPSDPVQITGHFCLRWRERVDRAATDDQIAAWVLGHLRSLPRGAGQVKPGADGQPALYVNIHPLGRRGDGATPGWRIKLCPALGDGWVAHTVSRGHSLQSNQAERDRRRRRSWQLWLDWCRERGETPIDNEPGLQRLGRELDGKATNQHRHIPRVVRVVSADALGVDRVEYLAGCVRSEIRSATGAVMVW